MSADLANAGLPVPADDAVDDVVADFVAAVGDRRRDCAVVHDGAAVTYGDLAARVEVAAAHYRLHRTGSDAADLVGVLVSHTPAVVEHLLGVLQAGATYCPIDATLPAARKNALAAVLGLDRLHAIAGDPRGATNLPVEVVGGDLVAACPERTLNVPRPGDAAYVLCTSGSTGTPKAVVVSRQSLTTTVRALRSVFALRPEDRVLQFASLGWDTCLEEILPALTSGATLVFDDEAHTRSFPRFVRMLSHRRVTVVDLPTAFWHELVLYLYEHGIELPNCVRLVVIGGERVDPTRLRQWREMATAHVRLLNTYGCTETTMITHAVELAGPHADVDCATGDAPLGRALPHVVDHVTGDGELLVSGACLATGYLGLTDRTATDFEVADHGTGPTRWFHTGDIVTRGDGGLLHPRGRRDDQVKVLGVRVDPAEVEAELTAHPAVAAAVVMGERRLGQMSLHAYVVATAGVTPAELKGSLRARLPHQFVPARVTFVPALQYTSSGKVDRAATQRAATTEENEGARP
ncbi:AMP-binding protein [Mycobacterium yunnanensis]|uniref:AMP-binding protein n=1 Tax=Mycobacterium yunnanensis TaxID=368477 RepID=A0A9X3BRI0_9MYCO|nr:AMP-binding protein [Mycobacterium yunnanensis]MCV7418955.1 AMP-binding protein [Mycobacterium yunnanensis]